MGGTIPLRHLERGRRWTSLKRTQLAADLAMHDIQVAILTETHVKQTPGCQDAYEEIHLQAPSECRGSVEPPSTPAQAGQNAAKGAGRQGVGIYLSPMM